MLFGPLKANISICISLINKLYILYIWSSYIKIDKHFMSFIIHVYCYVYSIFRFTLFEVHIGYKFVPRIILFLIGEIHHTWWIICSFFYLVASSHCSTQLTCCMFYFILRLMEIIILSVPVVWGKFIMPKEERVSISAYVTKQSCLCFCWAWFKAI
jgi:hypothetical protein